MIYGYIRVSTDKQTVENQRYEIKRFCEVNNLKVDKWISETISGAKEIDKRLLGKLLEGVQKDDIIICSEISRLGRSLFMVMSVLNRCMDIGAKVWTIKDNYRLGDDITSKVLAFAFWISAEIERKLISQRTKEALSRKKAEGVKLGRPCGYGKRKLDGKEQHIRTLIEMGFSKRKIAKVFEIHESTLYDFIVAKGMQDIWKIKKKQVK